MSATTIAEFEKERGILFIDRAKYPSDKKISTDELRELLKKQSDYKGVDHETRINFLQRNGYEVNHENMLNTELRSKSPDELQG